ncbi:hypothetical protein K456DRAFT_753468 [Colletotrichum gloeosporioides 23]|nr:hypothetical protein K456DRAFT_753468 [Colletotrichum gloeosporioides 23]
MSGMIVSGSKTLDFTDTKVEKSKPEKRRIEESGDGESDSEVKSQKPSSRKKSRGGTPRLACPYFKHDPVKHGCCARLKFPLPSRVKEHLLRRRGPKIRCMRCSATFASEVSLNQHLKSLIVCPFRPNSTPNDEISLEMEKQLRKRPKKRLSEEEQWFEIWDILFPSTQPPSPTHRSDELARQDVLKNIERSFTEEPNGAILSETQVKYVLDICSRQFGFKSEHEKDYAAMSHHSQDQDGANHVAGDLLWLNSEGFPETIEHQSKPTTQEARVIPKDLGSVEMKKASSEMPLDEIAHLQLDSRPNTTLRNFENAPI